MACYPIIFLFAAPLFGSQMQVLGRKNCVTFGLLMMALATLTFGLASLTSDSR